MWPARFALLTDAVAVEPLVSALEASARTDGEGCGAVCTFVGVVRATHGGRRVRFLDYEGFEPLAVRAFERVDAEVTREWPGARLAIHHRIGRLEVGEISVVAAAAAAHRAEAFEVCRYAIERVKQIAPIWKHEFFEDGDAWVEGAVSDPDDEAARLRARACV
jgi:molybdopterin synthase catalytic subunit